MNGAQEVSVEKIAELRHLPVEEVALQTWKNAHRLFRIAEND